MLQFLIYQQKYESNICDHCTSGTHQNEIVKVFELFLGLDPRLLENHLILGLYGAKYETMNTICRILIYRGL